MIRPMDHFANMPPSHTPDGVAGGRGKGRPFVPRYFLAADDRLLLLRDFGTYGRMYHALFSSIMPHWMFRKFTAENNGCRMHDEVAAATQAAIDGWRQERSRITVAALSLRLPVGPS